MSEVRRYEDLIAWQKAYQLVLAVYRLTASFPPDERFGLTQQLRRATVSVPSNIAEGYGRYGIGDYIRFLDIALGSTYEVQTQLRLSRDLNFRDDPAILDAMAEVERVLSGLIRSLRRKQSP